MAFADSPLRYPGGKSSLNELMKDVLRHNSLRLCTYAEPFAGGCGLALRLMFEGMVSRDGRLYADDTKRSVSHKSFFKDGFALGLSRWIGKNTQCHIDRTLF